MDLVPGARRILILPVHDASSHRSSGPGSFFIPGAFYHTPGRIHDASAHPGAFYQGHNTGISRCSWGSVACPLATRRAFRVTSILTSKIM